MHMMYRERERDYSFTWTVVGWRFRNRWPAVLGPFLGPHRTFLRLHSLSERQASAKPRKQESYCIYIYTSIHTYLRTYLRTYIRIRTYVRTYIHTYIHTYISSFLSSYLFCICLSTHFCFFSVYLFMSSIARSTRTARYWPEKPSASKPIVRGSGMNHTWDFK